MSDMMDEFSESMALACDKALQKMKSFSEQS